MPLNFILFLWISNFSIILYFVYLLLIWNIFLLIFQLKYELIWNIFLLIFQLVSIWTVFFFFLWAFTLDMVGIHCFLDHMSSYVFIYSPFLMKYCLNKLLKLLRKKTFTWSGSYPTKILNTVYQILCSNSFHFLLKFYRILFTIS